MKKIYVILLSCIASVVLLFLAFILFIHSSFFLTRILLPFISRHTEVEISAQRIDWSWFDERIAVEKLRIGSEEDPLFQATSGSFCYDLQKLRKGIFKFSNLRVYGGDFSLYRHPEEGNWSCFRLAKSTMSPSKQKRNQYSNPPQASSTPRATNQVPKSGKATKGKKRKSSSPQFVFEDIAFENSRFALVYDEHASDGMLEISNLSGTISKLGENSRLDANLTGEIYFVSSQVSHIDSGRMVLKVSTVLDHEFVPRSLETSCDLRDLSGSVNDFSLSGVELSLALSASGNGSEIKIEKLSLGETQGGKSRSSVDVSGRIGGKPWSLEANFNTGKLSGEITSILSELLFGFNPGIADLEYRGKLSYISRKLSANGRIRLNRTGDAILEQERITLPDFQLEVDHDGVVDLASSSIDLTQLRLAVITEEGENLLLKLREPVKYEWLMAGQSQGKSAGFDLEFKKFNLALLRFLAPQQANFHLDAGELTGKVQLSFRHNLSAVSILGGAKASSLQWRLNDQKQSLEEAILGIDGELKRDFIFQLNSLSATLLSKSSELATLTLSGKGKIPDRTCKLNLRLDRGNARLLAQLFPDQKQLPDIWEQLRLTSLAAFVEVELTPDGCWSVLKTEATLRREAQDFSKLTIAPFLCMPGKNLLREPARFQLVGATPAMDLMPFLNGNKVELKQGNLEWRISGELSRSLTSLTANGRIFAGAMTVQHQGKTYNDFTLQNSFSLHTEDFKTIDAKLFDFYLRRGGKPALRLECPGIWDLSDKSYHGKWTIRYLNEQFLQLLYPTLDASVQLTGSVEVDGKDKLSIAHLAGSMECVRWQHPTMPDPLAGRMQFVLDWDPTALRVNPFQTTLQNNGQLADLSGQLRVDMSASDGRAELQLNSDLIDLEKLIKIFKPIANAFQEAPKQHLQPDVTEETGRQITTTQLTRNSQSESHPTRTKQNTRGRKVSSNITHYTSQITPTQTPKLYLGTHPLDAELIANNIRFSPEVSGSLKSRIILNSDQVSTDYCQLIINKAKYSAKIMTTNQKDGIRNLIQIRGSDTLPLHPVLALMQNNDNNLIPRARLRNLDLQMEWLDNGETDSFLQTLTGNLQMGVDDVVIPHSTMDGAFARILLYPIDLVSKLEQLIPEQFVRIDVASAVRDQLNNGLKTVQFSNGNISLRVDKGVLQVEDCGFNGGWVNRMTFSGSADLAGAMELNLVSKLSIGGMQFVLPIRGTIASPSVQWDATASGSKSVRELLNRLADLKLISLEEDADGNSEPLLVLKRLPGSTELLQLKQMFGEIFTRNKSSK